jgi:hypothetical protein
MNGSEREMFWLQAGEEKAVGQSERCIKVYRAERKEFSSLVPQETESDARTETA